MHKISGVRESAATFGLRPDRDDAAERRAANRAVGVSAIGLTATGIVELLLAVLARYKLVAGRRIHSATLVADARHSWLDALSSAGALAGLIAVAVSGRLPRAGSLTWVARAAPE